MPTRPERPLSIPLISAATATPIEQLSACVLQLSQVARKVPASEFLSHAVVVLREVIGFSSGWWGLATDPDKSKIPSIYQAEYLDLPANFASDWRAIAEVDDFGRDIRNHAGQVQRFAIDEAEEIPAVLAKFDSLHGLHKGMGVTIDDASTGHVFFIVVYRGASDFRFGDDEAVMFLHLLRHTIQLWHHGLQDALLKASTEDISHAALARLNGRLVYAGPALCELLYAQWPEWDGITLPAEVITRFKGLPCNLRLSDGAINISARGELIWLVRASSSPATPLLSPRERRVAHLFAGGHSYKEIARLLKLSPATVRTYLRDAYVRLGVRNKVQLGDALGDGTKSRG